MEKVRLKVYAKINLSLDIVGERADRHLLDSVMASVSVFDEIVAYKTSDNGVSVTVNGVDFTRSNAYKSALAMKERYNLGGMAIEITPNIPSGGGLGGSSADGAGVIRAIEKLFNLDASPKDLVELALSIGSDVPYMLNGGLCRLRGVGEDLTFYDYDGGEEVLLAGVGEVSTAKCFALYDSEKPEVTVDNDKLIRLLGDKTPLIDCAHLMNNALQPVAMKLNDGVGKILEVMTNNGLLARMSGSGAYCFGLGSGECLDRAQRQLADLKINCIRASIVTKGVEFN
ncbi:MAG: hypothetical protein IKC64_03495 [Clostridia bacterium]|nr:hypothetical protein [Clostridia bacterium]